MTDDAKPINAADLGCSDLDEMATAKKLIDALGDVGQDLELDLRECFLDYGPCSRVTEHLLNSMAALPGSKTLSIDTLIDLGSAEAMALLLTKNAAQLIGGQREAPEVLSHISEYCQSHGIEFIINIFQVDTDKQTGAIHYKPARSYELSATPVAGADK